MARLATNAAAGSATERAVLLSLGAVGGEGVGESCDGRGGVDARSVVDGLCKIGRLAGGYGWMRLRVGPGEELLRRTRDRALADEADQRGAGSTAEGEGGTHCDVWCVWWVGGVV